MISLIFCGDLKYCPYIHRYIERFKENEIEYEVVFWNRSGEIKQYPQNYKYYDVQSDLEKSKLSKIKDFFGFRRWLQNYLRNTKCEKFVLLSTLSGVLIEKELKNCHAKYIFDIRDYSYESFFPYYEIEEKVIHNSFGTVISSEGFKNFLPKDYEYVIAHNFNRRDVTNKSNFFSYDGKVRLVWNGLIRYFDYQSKIMIALANDKRFEMIYHGDGPELVQFKKFCEKNSIHNVHFTGFYDNKNKAELLSNATVLNNCYGYRKKAGNKIKYAISNKFYDGIIYRIPQIVEGNGYKAQLVKKNGIGMALDLKGDIGNQIIMYLQSLDIESFYLNCNNLLNKIVEEDNRFIDMIDSFSMI